MAQSYRVDQLAPPVRCALIADDLTGACDAAAPFRAQGASARVVLNSDDGTEAVCNVLSFSTDSRDLPVSEMKNRLGRVAAKLEGFAPTVVFKKIDSTLRGNPGEEIAAALQAFDCNIAVITPAFPELGRLVCEEHLLNEQDPFWKPLHVRTLLRSQGLACEHISPASLRAALTGEALFLSVETAAIEDLEHTVRETLACGRRVLWAGSAGLARALARALFPISCTPGGFATQDAPILFAIGSNHVVTTGQLAQLSSRFSAHYLDADSVTAETLTAALRSRRHTILRIGRDTTTGERLAALLANCERTIGALLLCGGDTASLVCRAIGADAITLEGEVATGVPWGIIEGGLLNKIPVATKSGAFGAPDVLINVADFFSCLPH